MRYTDEELLSLYKTELYHAQAEMRRQTRAGRPWLGCPNCTQPYPVDRPGASLDTCSVQCRQEYAQYLLARAEVGA